MPAAGLVTETLAYDGGRPVTVYVPPDPPEAVVFAGDGQEISRWGGFLGTAAGATGFPAWRTGNTGGSSEIDVCRIRAPIPGGRWVADNRESG